MTTHTKWTQEIEALLGTASDPQIARKLGISTAVARHRRRMLGIPAFQAIKLKWSSEEEALLGTTFDADVADQLGLSVNCVRHRRCVLGIPSYITVVWTSEMDAILGMMSDEDVATELGIYEGTVRRRKHQLGIASFRPNTAIQWTSEMEIFLGTASDQDVADELGISRSVARKRRDELGIPPSRFFVDWTPEMDALLGTEPDWKLAEHLEIPKPSVRYRRKMLGIPSWRSQSSSLPRTRYQLRNKLPDVLTYEQWNFACNYFDNRCAYCRGSIRLFLTQDHLVPVNQGGTTIALNIVPACQSCNSSKSDKCAHLWIYKKFGMEEGKEIVDDIVTYLKEVKSKYEA